MGDLPKLRACPTCPAALPIAGASDAQRGVVCRVMQRDHVEDAGLNMSAAQSGFIQHEATGGVYLNLLSDPSTVAMFCHGDAVPVVTDEEGQGRASFTYCPTWQAEKQRIEAGRDELLVDVEPDPVSMGVPEPDYADPWKQARADLDLLAS